MTNIINALINNGVYGIMLAAFAEAIFMPVPMEVVSIPIYLLNPSRSILYSLILIAFSFLGSITGYFLAGFLGKPLLTKFENSGVLHQVRKLYDKNSFLTVLTSSFTPIPYEAYVLSAGALNIGFPKFALASLLSRIIRHLPQGVLVYFYGESILYYAQRYTLAVGLILIVFIVVLKRLIPSLKP